MTALKARLTGLVACLAIVFLIVGTPFILIATDAVPTPSDFSWSRLTAPDDGTLALVIISGVAWIAWAVMVVTLGTETLARLRGMPALRLPGFTVPQLAAGRLVAVAALLFVSAPIASSSLSTPPAAAALMSVAPAAAPSAASPESSPPVAVQETSPEPTFSYTVKRGDSLWKIAEEHLGDGTRYNEIVALNQSALNGQPDFINPGLVLRLPDEGRTDQADQYVVQPGDTLSEIAQRELGDADAYPKIFEASRDTVQPDGRQLEDPDLILPNWKLTLPRQASRNRSEDEQSEKGRDRAETTPSTAVPEPAPQEPETDAAAAAVDDSGDFVVPGWALVGLTGAGAVLAGSLLLVLRQHRRTQLRYRTPGHVLVPPPPELLDVEKTAHLTGSVSAPRVDVLDRALRSLSSSCAEVPRLSTVELSATAHHVASDRSLRTARALGRGADHLVNRSERRRA